MDDSLSDNTVTQEVGGGLITVYGTGRSDYRGAPVFGYKITDENGILLYEAEDIALSPLRADEARNALPVLLSFLSAAAEARSPESENWTLFNDATREWAQQNADEITILSMELDEAADLRV